MEYEDQASPCKAPPKPVPGLRRIDTMHTATPFLPGRPTLFWLLTACCLLLGFAAQAQDSNYDVGERGNFDQGAGRVEPGEGPVRLARFSYVSGNVTWRGDEHASWSSANVHLPLRQGAEIWVTDGGRAEIQFDDGSLIRLGNGAVATLQTLYSDSDGEF